MAREIHFSFIDSREKVIEPKRENNNPQYYLMKAIAVFQGRLRDSYVVFSQSSPVERVYINCFVEHLPKNSLHGFHIHTFGNLLSRDCKSCGGHWNPHNKHHGSLRARESHAGDLGNLETDNNGKAYITFSTSKITLFGKNSIIGRSVVVHSREDDLGRGKNTESLVTGNAGSRLDCAVIGIMNF